MRKRGCKWLAGAEESQRLRGGPAAAACWPLAGAREGPAGGAGGGAGATGGGGGGGGASRAAAAGARRRR